MHSSLSFVFIEFYSLSYIIGTDKNLQNENVGLDFKTSSVVLQIKNLSHKMFKFLIPTKFLSSFSVTLDKFHNHYDWKSKREYKSWQEWNWKIIRTDLKLNTMGGVI